MAKRSLIFSIGVCVLVALTTLPAPAATRERLQEEEARREVYTGALVGVGGTLGGRTATFTLTLTGRASRSQALRYADLLRREGQSALLKQLQGRDMGTFAVEGQVGLTVNFAYVRETPEGRRITILFERWLQPFELRYGTRSQDYPFSYMELSIDNRGRGNGTLIGAAKVYFDKDDPGTLNVENFSTYPLRVVNVELAK